MVSCPSQNPVQGPVVRVVVDVGAGSRRLDQSVDDEPVIRVLIEKKVLGLRPALGKPSLITGRPVPGLCLHAGIRQQFAQKRPHLLPALVGVRLVCIELSGGRDESFGGPTAPFPGSAWDVRSWSFLPLVPGFVACVDGSPNSWKVSEEPAPCQPEPAPLTNCTRLVSRNLSNRSRSTSK